MQNNYNSTTDKPRPTSWRRSAPSHRGVALIAVIGLMAVASVLFVIWAQAAVARLRVQKTRHDHVQATWLAEAGLRRAAAQIQIDDAYLGETWNVSAERLQRKAGAVVTITAEPLAGRPHMRRVTATAQLPPGEAPRARHTKSLDIPLDPLNNSREGE